MGKERKNNSFNDKECESAWRERIEQNKVLSVKPVECNAMQADKGMRMKYYFPTQFSKLLHQWWNETNDKIMNYNALMRRKQVSCKKYQQIRANLKSIPNLRCKSQSESNLRFDSDWDLTRAKSQIEIWNLNLKICWPLVFCFKKERKEYIVWNGCSVWKGIDS
jgi:hypothetical protein